MASGRHVLTGHLPFQYEVASTLACSRYARDGLARVLEQIVHAQAWDVGVAWLADGRHLRYLADCVAPDTELDGPHLDSFLESVRAWLRSDGISADGVCACRTSPCAAACAWGRGAARDRKSVV